jgi:DNA repair exonuclease SbcCD ATPase subunit
MKVKRLKCENFLSYASLDLALPDNDVVFIKGVNHDKNGSSNGSGKSSLYDVALYALYGTTARGALKRNVIRQGANQAMAACEFEHNGSEYYVERVFTPSKSQMSLICDGNDITRSTYEETNSLLTEIIGIPLDVFIVSTLLSVNVSLTFSGLTDAKRKKVLDYFIGVDFDDILKKFSGAVKEIETKVQTNHEELIRCESRLLALKGQVDTLLKIISSLPLKPEPLNVDVPRTQVFYQTLIDKIRTAKNYIDNLDRLIISIEQMNVCPTCHRKLYPRQKDKILDPLCKQKSIYKGEYEELVKKQTELEPIIEKIKDYERRMYHYESSLKACESAKASLTQVREEIEKLTPRIEVLKKENSELTLKQEALRFWHKAFGSSGIKVYTYHSLLEHINGILEVLSNKLFGGKIKVLINIDATSPSIPIVIDTMIENASRPIELLSGGERRRVDILLTLALRSLVDYKVKLPFIFFDETFDVIDHFGKEELISHFDSFECPVFIISHDPIVESSAMQRTILVEKKNNISTAIYV